MEDRLCWRDPPEFTVFHTNGVDSTLSERSQHRTTGVRIGDDGDGESPSVMEKLPLAFVF